MYQVVIQTDQDHEHRVVSQESTISGIDEENFQETVQFPLLDDSTDVNKNHNVKPTELSSFSYVCGLAHPDKQTRQRTQAFCVTYFLILFSIIVPITFLVIIPWIVRDFVNGSTIEIQSVTISNPTSNGFQSTVVQKFSLAPPGGLSVTIAFDPLNVVWTGQGGGTLVSLQDMAPVTASTGYVVMNSNAVVINSTALQDYNINSMHSASSVWNIQGSAKVTAVVPVKCNIDKAATLYGFNNFPVPAVINSVQTTSGSYSTVHNTISATMTSVSNIAIKFGQNLNFSLVSNGINIGWGYIPNCNFALGTSNLTIYSGLTYTSDIEKAELMRILSGYAAGKATPVVLSNFYTPRPISWLSKALADMEMDSVIPGVTSSFLIHIYLYIPSQTVYTAKNTYVNLEFNNPIDTPIRIQMINSTVYCSAIGKSVFLSTLDAYIPDGGLYVASHGSARSGKLYTTPAPTSKDLIKTISLIESQVYTFFDVVNPNLVFYIDQFKAIISYNQSNVAVTVSTYVCDQSCIL